MEEIEKHNPTEESNSDRSITDEETVRELEIEKHIEKAFDSLVKKAEKNDVDFRMLSNSELERLMGEEDEPDLSSHNFDDILPNRDSDEKGYEYLCDRDIYGYDIDDDNDKNRDDDL